MSEQSTPGTSPTLFLSDADVASLADWPSVVGALAAAYSCRMSEAMVPPRSMARGDGVWLRSLTAVSPSGGHLGCKLIAASLRGLCQLSDLPVRPTDGGVERADRW